MGTFETIGCILMIWCILSIFFNFVNGIMFEWKGLVLHLPKNQKKYKDRKSPIYELHAYSGWIDDDWYGIRKWELKYHRTIFPIFWFICPLPLTFYVYKYDIVGMLCSIKKENLEKISKPLSELYEAKWRDENAEDIAKKEQKDKLNSKVDELNDEFKVNYIKSRLS